MTTDEERDFEITERTHVSLPFKVLLTTAVGGLGSAIAVAVLLWDVSSEWHRMANDIQWIKDQWAEAVGDRWRRRDERALMFEMQHRNPALDVPIPTEKP